MTLGTLRITVFVGLVAVLAWGCSSSGSRNTNTTPRSSSPTPTQTGGFSGETYPDGGETAPAPELATIYFDFDRSDVREDARRLLRNNAQTMQSNPSLSAVVLEGHCDERGSEEYNLALGERRATAAKRYLVDLGVGSGQMDTVSFGESSPAVQGHDESAWHWNRRVEFRVAR